MFEFLTLLKIEVIEYGKKWASKWLEMHSQRHRFFFKKSGGGPPYPPGMTRKCKIIVRNRVFEFLTSLKIYVYRIWKNGLQNGLKCIHRDIDFFLKKCG